MIYVKLKHEDKPHYVRGRKVEKRVDEGKLIIADDQGTHVAEFDLDKVEHWATEEDA